MRVRVRVCVCVAGMRRACVCVAGIHASDAQRWEFEVSIQRKVAGPPKPSAKPAMAAAGGAAEGALLGEEQLHVQWRATHPVMQLKVGIGFAVAEECLESEVGAPDLPAAS